MRPERRVLLGSGGSLVALGGGRSSAVGAVMVYHPDDLKGESSVGGEDDGSFR
jgi:hypothetical protein